MLIKGPAGKNFWRGVVLTSVATIALVVIFIIWHESYSSTNLMQTPHTCVTPTPNSLYGGFRSPYPSAPFCTGR